MECLCGCAWCLRGDGLVLDLLEEVLDVLPPCLEDVLELLQPTVLLLLPLLLAPAVIPCTTEKGGAILIPGTSGERLRGRGTDLET
jgi:hypothetical protein